MPRPVCPICGQAFQVSSLPAHVASVRCFYTLGVKGGKYADPKKGPEVQKLVEKLHRLLGVK